MIVGIVVSRIRLGAGLRRTTNELVDWPIRAVDGCHGLGHSVHGGCYGIGTNPQITAA